MNFEYADRAMMRPSIASRLFETLFLLIAIGIGLFLIFGVPFLAVWHFVVNGFSWVDWIVVGIWLALIYKRLRELKRPLGTSLYLD